MHKPDVYVVLRKPNGFRPTMAFPGAVFNTHNEALVACHRHREALRVHSRSDASSVYVQKTTRHKRIR